MQLDTILKEYFLDLKIKNYSPKTIINYEAHLSKFKAILRPKVEIEDISLRDYKTFINKLLNDDLKPSYINAILKSHKAFWTYVLDEGLIQKSPIEKIKLLKETKDVLIPFSDVEVKRMLSVWNSDKYLSFRNRAIIALLFDTGIRAHELISITDDDISDNYIKIHGKGDKWRVVPLSLNLRYILTKYIRIRNNHFKSLRNRNSSERKLGNTLFLNKSGRSMKTIKQLENIFLQTCQMSEVRNTVKQSPHQARHYFSIKNLQLGASIYTISKMLGHTNLKTTQVYLQSITDYQLIQQALQTNPLDSLL